MMHASLNMVEWKEATDSKLHKDLNKTIHRRHTTKAAILKYCREATVQGRDSSSRDPSTSFSEEITWNTLPMQLHSPNYSYISTNSRQERNKKLKKCFSNS